MRVLKFGGTSVGNAERMRGVAEIVGPAGARKARSWWWSRRSAASPTRCCAAPSEAAAGGSVVPALARFHSVHREILDALRDELGAARAAEAETELGALEREMENLLRGFGLLRECPPAALALLSSLGERASCALVSRLLAARGLDARLLDPKTLIRTSGSAALRLARLAGHPPGLRPPARGAPGGGRPARLLRRRRQRPRQPPGARRLGLLRRHRRLGPRRRAAGDLDRRRRHLQRRPAAGPQRRRAPRGELRGGHGALLLRRQGAASRRPSSRRARSGSRCGCATASRPDHPGSLVHDGAAPAASGARGLTFLPGVSLVDVTGSGMAGVPGVAARVFQAMAAAGISVILITQGSSECAISFAVADADGPLRHRGAARGLRRRAHRRPPRSHPASAPAAPCVSLVGDGMRDRLGVVGTFAGALADVGVNIVALAQGSTERNISAVVAAADARRAVRHIHAQLFERRPELQLVVWGVGNVGSKLLRKIGEHQARAGRRVDLKLCARGQLEALRLRPRGARPGRLGPAASTPPPSPPASTPCWRSSAAPGWSTPCSSTAPRTARWPPPTAACSRPACTW